MRRVQSDAARSVAGSKRPACDHFVFGRIDYRHFVFVLDIAVNAAGSLIYRCEFRTASERNCRNSLRFFRVDHRR